MLISVCTIIKKKT